jgi:molybdate transport system permease protein
VSAEDLGALTLTLKLALVTTVLLLVLGTPLAWWLARSRARWKVLVEAVVALPIVLPPTVLGFYLLVLMGPQGPLGKMLVAAGGAPLVFRFEGLVLGSLIYSLPFVVQPLQASFEGLDERVLEAASTLRAGPLDRFLSVVVPMARPGFLTAAVLGFAHTLGEFGVVLMVGGNIPGETKVLSIAIYDHVEALEYSQAHWLSGIMLALSFVLLLVVYTTNRGLLRRTWA